MKKTVLFFALMMSAISASAQDDVYNAKKERQSAAVDNASLGLTESGAYERKEVIVVDGASAAMLFDRAMIALADWAGPDGKAKAGIDYQSQETHTVIYKGSFYAGSRRWMMDEIDRYANFTVKVRCKDGRAQVTVNVGTLTAKIESMGRSQTRNLGQVIAEMKKTSGKRRERGEEALAYITTTADNILAAMKAALTGLGGGSSDDDF